jgi:AraC family transcriptional regulator, regulatory protein of adaptative response / methylated-DNA-[protein]-cysteine methyltransferase
MSKLLSPIGIIFGFKKTPLGTALIGAFEDAICYLSFGEDVNSQLKEMRATLWNYKLEEDSEQINEIAKQLFTADVDVPVYLCGTEFQVKVWQALTTIPFGTTVSYEEVAKMVGRPQAIRAVASAIAKNNIAYIIPCHRVIRKSGQIHKYRWGIGLKKKLLQYEAYVKAGFAV